MIQGYKCDFCSNFKENKNDIEFHELTCSFNPKCKGCYTCKNYYPNSYHSEHCTLSIVTNSEFWEYLDKDNCPYHQIEVEC